MRYQQQFLLQMAGLTGSGKSTLARAIGRETGAAILDKDVIMAAALRGGFEPDAVGGLAYEVCFALADDLLLQGLSVILDTTASFTLIRDKGAALAQARTANYFIIECRLESSDANEKRLNQRTPLHMLHPTSLDGVDTNFSRPGTSPLHEPHLTVDTAQSGEQCLALALDYLGLHAGLPR